MTDKTLNLSIKVECKTFLAQMNSKVFLHNDDDGGDDGDDDDDDDDGDDGDDGDDDGDDGDDDDTI